MRLRRTCIDNIRTFYEHVKPVSSNCTFFNYKQAERILKIYASVNRYSTTWRNLKCTFHYRLLIWLMMTEVLKRRTLWRLNTWMIWCNDYDVPHLAGYLHSWKADESKPKPGHILSEKVLWWRCCEALTKYYWKVTEWRIEKLIGTPSTIYKLILKDIRVYFCNFPSFRFNFTYCN